MIQEGV